MATNIRTLKPHKLLGPGFHIQEEMDERGWTQEDLADVLGVSLKTVNQLLQNKQSITLETAKSLSEAFKQSPQFWMKLDTDYRLQLQAQQTQKEQEVAQRSEIYEFMPINEMAKLGWIPKTKVLDELILRVKKFWNSDKIDFARLREKSLPLFKKSVAHENFDYYAAACWFQMAQNCAKSYTVPEYNKTTLEKLFEELYTFTARKNGIAEFLSMLNQSGVAFFCLKHLPRTYIDGAAFLANKTPIVVYTCRYNRVDNFWFTIAHEIVHVLKHLSEVQPVIIDEDIMKNGSGSEQETEANQMAQKALKHEEILEFFKNSMHYKTREQIVECAENLEIHKSIVVGALAYNDFLSYKHTHEFKEDVWSKIPFEYLIEKRIEDTKLSGQHENQEIE